MNANWAILLPFFASMLAIFIAPILSSRLQQKTVEVKKNVDHSSIIDNYTGALDSAWKRIDILERNISKMESDRDALIVSLEKENTQLKIRLYDLEREIAFLKRNVDTMHTKQKEYYDYHSRSGKNFSEDE